MVTDVTAPLNQPEEALNMIISARERDLGGLVVRRILPYASHRMVGPFIFFDHMGPTEYGPGEGMDVRPHPHINLATVTYLFEGQILHRDSLGSEQLIEPGAINWMVAGRGIVHSERTSDETRARGSRLSGIQCWIALPEAVEECEPSFTHHPKLSLPEFEHEGTRFRLLLGTALNHKSPVEVHSDLFYLEAFVPKGTRMRFPTQCREGAVYVVDGKLRFGDSEVNPGSLGVSQGTEDLIFESLESSHLMLLGGESLGTRFIHWNFVSSSRTRLNEAKAEWARWPLATNVRFSTIPGDDREFIPLPAEAGTNPKGTPL